MALLSYSNLSTQTVLHVTTFAPIKYRKHTISGVQALPYTVQTLWQAVDLEPDPGTRQFLWLRSLEMETAFMFIASVWACGVEQSPHLKEK